jgi:hypothetical protein
MPVATVRHTPAGLHHPLTQGNHSERRRTRVCCWLRVPTEVPLGSVNRSKHTGRPSALLAKSGLVAAFLAGTSPGVGGQNAHADGIVRCWGWNVNGQCDTPTDLGPCSSVAGGGYHTVALRSDGSVRCWGDNYWGQCNTPADLGACSSIAGGRYHTIAIEPQCLKCPSSLTRNCIVNGADLGILLNAWGSSPAGTTGCTGDINAGGQVDGADLGYLLNAWGPCPN